ncbi:MAG: hypothetical protein JRN21_09280 [Nitrososphaerota archaeon]|nr:hypothetical protein [Nitrososphaerota archaeon]
MTSEFDNLYEIFKKAETNSSLVPLAIWLADICIPQADKKYASKLSFEEYVNWMNSWDKKRSDLWKKYDYLCGPVHHGLAHGLGRDDPLGDHKVLSTGTQQLIILIKDLLTGHLPLNAGELPPDGYYRWEYILKEFPDAKLKLKSLMAGAKI